MENQDKLLLWLSEARNDFEMAEILLNSEKYNGAVFYYVQSAEKAIKALLYYHNLTPWGHSILNLIEEYEKISHTIDFSLKKIAQDLSRNYITSRYPDFSIKIAPKDIYDSILTNEIKEKNQKILNFVENEKKEVNNEQD